MKNIITTIVILLFNLLNVFAQIGSPFIQNYDPEELGVNPQIWDITQDKRGVMYFGCNDCLLEYNGKDWRKIEIKYAKGVLSLDCDSAGTVYVGSWGEFGYLRPNNLGKMEYVSLSKDLDTAYSSFTDVWDIYSTREGVYFCTDFEIFRYKYEVGKSTNECIKVFKAKTEYKAQFYVYDSLYVASKEGMLVMRNDSLVPLHGKEFAQDLLTLIALPYPEDKILLANDADGLYLYNPKAKDKSEALVAAPYLDANKTSEVNNFIRNNYLYAAIALNDSTYALGSVESGIVIINKEGEVIRRINKSNGLQSDIIQRFFLDKQSGLWVALGFGISRIDLSSPFSFWDKNDGLNGPLRNVCEHNGQVYAGTDLGIFQMTGNKFKPLPQFRHKTDIQSVSIASVKMPDSKYHLLSSQNYGIFEILEDKVVRISTSGTELFKQSSLDASKIYISDRHFLKNIQYKNGKWTKSKILVDLKEDFEVIYEENADNLWTILAGKPYKIKVRDAYKVDSISLSNINDTVFFHNIVTINDEMTFLTNAGLFHYDNQNIVKDSVAFDGCLNNIPISDIKKVDENNYYVLISNNDGYKMNLGLVAKEAGKYKFKTIPFKKMKYINKVYLSNNKKFWVISPKRLFKIHENQTKYGIVFHTLINRVTVNRDSVIFAGAYYDESASRREVCLNQPKNFIPTLAYEDNHIAFEFVMTSYEEENLNLYSYTISKNGEEEQWSHWTHETKKEYTNLDEGEYVFKVKSKNIFGTESSVSKYSFIIAPPWYRTYWAYVFYVIFFVIFVYILIKLKIRHLQKENDKLEKIVKERTDEITKQNEEILQQKEEIEAIADNLKNANEKILQSNKEIKTKNRQITDSIQYAKRIQTAAMPKHEQIKELLPSHFIFFKPRDIVSGDYYWIREIKDFIIVMAADCTGHGIPGAFMSMLGISLYNEIARRPEITNLAQSLNYLRSELKNTLDQTSEYEETKDGIDLSVIAIDRKNHKLQYAGANNPIFVVQNNELKMYEADKMPVGVSLIEQPFTNQTIDINDGDLVYLFSDGYIDQFGGEKYRRFTRQRFQRLIEACKDKPIDEQYEIIKNTHEKWRNNTMQLDDILVIGLKIEKEMLL